MRSFCILVFTIILCGFPFTMMVKLFIYYAGTWKCPGSILDLIHDLEDLIDDLKLQRDTSPKFARDICVEDEAYETALYLLNAYKTHVAWSRKYNWLLLHAIKHIILNTAHLLDLSPDLSLTLEEKVHNLRNEIKGMLTRPT